MPLTENATMAENHSGKTFERRLSDIAGRAKAIARTGFELTVEEAMTWDVFRWVVCRASR